MTEAQNRANRKYYHRNAAYRARQQERARAWNRNNRERRKSYNKSYYQANKERILARRKTQRAQERNARNEQDCQ